MRRSLQIALSLIFVAALGTGTARAQAWAGVISSPRAITWNPGAGLTIPTRSNCATQPSISLNNSGAAASNGLAIRNAIQACAGFKVNLPAGTFYADQISYGPCGSACGGAVPISNVSLVGAGANSTFVIITAGSNCNGLGAAVCLLNGDNNDSSNPHNLASWTGGYSPGTTSITINSFTAGSISNLFVGSMVVLDQQNPGSDTGNIWICDSSGVTGNCSQQGGSGNGQPGRSQNQVVKVTSISGSGPWTIGITPGIYAPNWTSGLSPDIWFSGQLPITGDVAQGFSVNVSSISCGGLCGGVFMMTNAYGNWIDDVIGVNNGSTPYHKHVWLYQTAHNSVTNSYFYGSNGTSESYGVDSGYSSSDNLSQNNICQHVATCGITEGDSGSVFAYNYAVDDYYISDLNWQQFNDYHHGVGDCYVLFEGTEGIGNQDDDIHGTSCFGTTFRGFYNGRDPAITGGQAKNQNTGAEIIMAYNRYYNLVGNIFGTSGYNTNYTFLAPNSTDCGNSSTANVSVYVLAYSGSQGINFGPCSGQSSWTLFNDTLVGSTLLRWANLDATNGGAGGTAFSTAQYNNAEVPSGISPYPNSVPASHTLPCTFFLATGCTAPGWWSTNVGTPPWPPKGPDVTGGTFANGHANHNVAGLCYLSIMGGQTDGSSGLLPFDAYAASPIGCGYGTNVGPPGTPEISFSPSSYTWPGTTPAGGNSAQETITVSNTGTATLLISTVSLTGADPSDFQPVQNQCEEAPPTGVGGVLGPGASCFVIVQFSPLLTSTGVRTASLTFTSNATPSVQSVGLQGTVTGSGPPGTPGAPAGLAITIH